jgi:putative membrane protein
VRRKDHQVRGDSRTGGWIEARDRKNSLHTKGSNTATLQKLSGFAKDVFDIFEDWSDNRCRRTAQRKSIQLQFLMEKPIEQDPRVYFAAERTFLAWIRTGLALMGVGFAVSRFGLFLRQLGASESHFTAKSTGISVWSGVILVGLGILVNISSAVRYRQTVRQLSAGTWIAGRASTEAVVLALLLAAAGLGMGVYLTVVR